MICQGRVPASIRYLPHKRLPDRSIGRTRPWRWEPGAKA
jgi:hypothetical protein